MMSAWKPVALVDACASAPADRKIKILPLLLAFMIVGCASTSGSNADEQMPVFPRMTFDSDILLTAGLFGTLEQRGRCLVIAGEDGSYFTPYWPRRSQLGRDRNGYFVEDASSGEIIRPGDFIVGGGGFAFREGDGEERLNELNALIAPDIPAECSQKIASIHSFRKSRKWYVGHD